MSLKIVDECIACDACVEVCPTIAIMASDPIYVVDSEICCECVGFKEKSACVEVCPVDAIVLDEEIIESCESLLKKAQRVLYSSQP